MKKQFGDGRDVQADPRCSMPPRTREGKTYPGGKFMRRALAKLSLRQANVSTGAGYRKPGSMSH